MKKILFVLVVVWAGVIFIKSKQNQRMQEALVAPPVNYKRLSESDFLKIKSIKDFTVGNKLKSQAAPILSDSTLIRKSYLTYVTAFRGDTISSKELEAHTKFLVSALGWKKNPKREQLCEAVQSILILGTLPESTQPVSFNEKLQYFTQLYGALASAAPKLAVELKTLNSSAELLQIINSYESKINKS